MPDLGKYAGAVLWSWGLTLAMIAVVVLMTWHASKKAKRALEAAEARAKGREAGQ